jgi:apolipoprotein N-acyltransferase
MKTHLKKYAPPAASGVLLALSFPAVSMFFLAWVAFVPLLIDADRKSPRQSALAFFLAGWIFHSIALHWLIANVMWAGGFAFVGYQLLCVAMAIFWGILGYAWRKARVWAPRLSGAVCFASLWILLETCHAHLFTGFGWNALAYSQGPDLLLVQWAVLGGTAIIGFAIAFVNGLLALAVCDRRLRVLRLIAAIVVIGGLHALGTRLLGETAVSDEEFRVGIVQTNYAQEMKWDREYTYEMIDLAAAKSLALSHHAPLDLIVWPEATVMTDFNRPRALERLTALAQDSEAAVFTGSVRHENRLSFNSSVLIAPDGTLAGFYDKIHLAPFGEYAPLAEWLPFLREVVPGEMDAGTEPRVFAVGARHLGPLICFEVLFPAMSEDLLAAGADFLVVVTNLGWFGASNASAQEFDIARLRAIETRLPLVHSANTGISGVFDPWGRFTAMNGYVNSDGRFVQRTGGPLPPGATRLQRLADTFVVPPAAERPWSAGPRVMPWAICAVGLVLLLLAYLLSLRARTSGQAN